MVPRILAGAELATPSLEYVKFFEDENHSLSCFTGLSLVSGIIIPHADHYSISEQVRSLICSNQGVDILKIPNDGVAVCKEIKGTLDVNFI